MFLSHIAKVYSLTADGNYVLIAGWKQPMLILTLFQLLT